MNRVNDQEKANLKVPVDLYSLLRDSMSPPVAASAVVGPERIAGLAGAARQPLVAAPMGIAPAPLLGALPAVPLPAPAIGVAPSEAGKIIRRLFSSKLPLQTKIWKHAGGKTIIDFPAGEPFKTQAEEIIQALACLGLSAQESPAVPIQVTEVKDITRRVTAYQIVLTPLHMQALQTKLQSAVPAVACSHQGLKTFFYCPSCCHFLKEEMRKEGSITGWSPRG